MNKSLEQQLAAFERRYLREKRAREEAEHQLEHYSRKIYYSNQTLIQNAEQARQQQTNLAFLSDVAQDCLQQQDKPALFQNYLDTLALYLSNSHVFLISYQSKTYAETYYYPTAFGDEFFEQKLISDLAAKWLANDDNQRVIDKIKHNPANETLFEAGSFAHYRNFVMPVQSTKLTAKSSSIRAFCVCLIDHTSLNIDSKKTTLASSVNMLQVALDRVGAERSLKHKLQQVMDQNEQINQYQQQLLESEKLASLGLLSAGVAHEINNPVGFISSNLEVMQDYIADMESPILALGSANADDLPNKINELKAADVGFILSDSKDIINSAITGINRIKEIVADLRQFSRMDSDSEHHEVEVDKVLLQALNMVHNELKYDYDVVQNIEPHSLIWGVEGPLQQVFVNFFINAKQAMPDGGCLSITCRKEKERTVVRIKDTGVGIEEQHLSELFTPFFTTKPVGQGTGLGLSISYSILQQHHAKVTVKSEIGKGTEFALSFVTVSSN